MNRSSRRIFSPRRYSTVELKTAKLRRVYLAELYVGGAELDQPLAKFLRLLGRCCGVGRILANVYALEAEQSLTAGEVE
jgi:hypothetical protein